MSKGSSERTTRPRTRRCRSAVISTCRTLGTLVERYFGSIPRGPAIERPTVTPATLTTEQRLVLEDAKATVPRLVIAWPGVGMHSPDVAPLDALAAILTQDRVSRLTKLLVYDRQLATSVSAADDNDEDEGYFEISVNPRPGVSLTTLEQLVDSTLDDLRAAPPTQAEVERTKRYAVVGTITGLEATELARRRIGRRVRPSSTIPCIIRWSCDEAEAVTPADVERVARQYLTPGRVVLSMVPAGHLDLVSKPSKPYANVTTTPERPAKGSNLMSSRTPIKPAPLRSA